MVTRQIPPWETTLLHESLRKRNYLTLMSSWKELVIQFYRSMKIKFYVNSVGLLTYCPSLEAEWFHSTDREMLAGFLSLHAIWFRSKYDASFAFVIYPWFTYHMVRLFKNCSFHHIVVAIARFWSLKIFVVHTSPCLSSNKKVDIEIKPPDSKRLGNKFCFIYNRATHKMMAKCVTTPA